MSDPDGGEGAQARERVRARYAQAAVQTQLGQRPSCAEADDRADPARAAAAAATVGALSGTLTLSGYRAGLLAAGLHRVTITPTQQVGEGVFSAIIQARRPAP